MKRTTAVTEKKEKKQAEHLLDMVEVIVFGDNHRWGKAPLLEDALKNAGKPKKWIAYVAHKDSTVDGMGNISSERGWRPQKIASKGLTGVVRQ